MTRQRGTSSARTKQVYGASALCWSPVLCIGSMESLLLPCYTSFLCTKNIAACLERRPLMLTSSGDFFWGGNWHRRPRLIRHSTSQQPRPVRCRFILLGASMGDSHSTKTRNILLVHKKAPDPSESGAISVLLSGWGTHGPQPRLLRLLSHRQCMPGPVPGQQRGPGHSHHGRCRSPH